MAIIAKQYWGQIGIQPGESKVVGLLFAHFCLIGAARSLTRTVAYALFLSTFAAATLPYLYLSVSLVLLLVTAVYLRTTQRFALMPLLRGTLLFLVVGLVLYQLALTWPRVPWLIFTLPIWYEIVWCLTGLETWALAGRLLTTPEGQRLFGVISAGEWLTIVAGGVVTPFLVQRVAIGSLLLIAAGALGVAWLLLQIITHQCAERLTSPALSGAQAAAAPIPALPIHQRRYVGFIFALFMLSVTVFFFVDAIFNAQVALRYPSEVQMAAFLSIFFALSSLLTLFSNAFLIAPLLRYWGMGRTLLVEPVVLAVCTGAMLLAALTWGAGEVFFGLGLLNKLLTTGIGLSVGDAVFKLLYQPLRAHERLWVQTMTEGVVYSLTLGVVGLLLLCFTY
ncbi:MAG: hypothetical protein ACOYNY_38345 [Caldilineaceae bacterium]